MFKYNREKAEKLIAWKKHLDEQEKSIMEIESEVTQAIARRKIVTDPIICDLIPSMMASLLTYTDTPPTTMARDTIPDDNLRTFYALPSTVTRVLDSFKTTA